MNSTKLSLRSAGYMLRQARLRAGLSLRELEESADVSASQILRVETGEYEPSLSTFASICRALGVPCGLLLEDCSPPPWEEYIEQAERDESSRSMLASLKVKNRNGIDYTSAVVALIASCRSVLEHLLASSNPVRFAELIDDYPTPALERAFKNAAQKIEDQFTAPDRLSSLKALQTNSVGELQNFGICNKEMAEGFLRSIEGEQSVSAWIPFNRELASAAIYKPATAAGQSPPALPPSLAQAAKHRSKLLIERFERLTSGRGERTAAAKAIGVSPQRLGGWIMGKSMPEAEILNRIERWIGEQERKTKKRKRN